MTQKLKSSHGGALTKSIPFDYLRAPTIILDAQNVEGGRFQKLLQEKLTALCRTYDVDPEQVDREHALTLARRYISGFQIERHPRSAPKNRKWDDVRLAMLWKLFRKARQDFPNNRRAIEYLAKQRDVRKLTGKVQPVWVEQLLDKARLSPLVQMMESTNPSDNKFARKLLAAIGPRTETFVTKW
jgi:hypothetical protein